MVMVMSSLTPFPVKISCMRTFGIFLSWQYYMMAFRPIRRHALELVAMARCNGCGAGIDKGFREKLDRIVSEGAEVCHLGVCTVQKDPDRECPTITEAAEYLAARGVEIVRGTH